MVSICSLISKSSSPCTHPFVTVRSALIAVGITVTLTFHSFYSLLARSKYVALFSLSFSFTLWSAEMAKSTILFFFFSFFWLSLGLVIWLKLDDPFLSQNSPKSCLIFQGGLWIIPIPFVRMVRLKLLSQLPVDHLAHPVVSSLILYLC